jgi:hypothetical protein
MIISHSNNYIFIHIPKCAGTALKSHLTDEFSYKDIEIGGSDHAEAIALYYEEKFQLKKHSTWLEIRNVIGAHDYEKFFKFCVIRNPYDRIYSIYRFLKFTWKQWPGSEIMDTFSSFEDFVLSHFFQSEGPDRIFNPQATWIADESNRLMVDCVLNTSNLTEETRKITTKLGLKSPIDSLQVRNESTGPKLNKEELFSNLAVRNAIEHKYQRDFSLLSLL